MTEPLDLTRRLRSWTYRRQRLDRTAGGPMEALRDVVAVYSSHPTAPLSLLCRAAPFPAERFNDLEQRRQVLRLPAMRRSIFLVPAETAPRVFAATRQPLEKLAPQLRWAGLDRDGYEQLKPRIMEHTQSPIAPNALKEAIRIDERLMTAVRIMTREGLVLRLGASLRSDSLRYVATEAWLGHPLAEADPDRSLIWLAEGYLRAFGPARVADFTWWSGVTRRRATAALAAVETVDLAAGLLLPADQQAAFESVEPVDPAALALLPKWDAYTMGHAPDGRRRLIDDEHLGRAYTGVGGRAATSGDGLPLVLRGGRAVASWSHRFDGARMLVQVQPFERGALRPERIAGAFEEIGTLLGATAVEVATAASS